MDDTEGMSDVELFARTIWGEARGEGYTGQQAVANVVMNRVNNPSWWGRDVRSVLTKPYQFSCWLEGDPNRPQLMAVTSADTVYKQCLSIAGMALSGKLDDIVYGATSYEVVGTNAKWSMGITPLTIIGKHEFFKLT